MGNKPARHIPFQKPTHPTPTAQAAVSEPASAISRLPRWSGPGVGFAGVERPAAPRAMRLTEPFGFIADWGAVYHKPAGSIISHPEELAILKGRHAPLEEV